MKTVEQRIEEALTAIAMLSGLPETQAPEVETAIRRAFDAVAHVRFVVSETKKESEAA